TKFSTIVTDALNRQTSSTQNVRGQKTAVVDANANTTSFVYAPLGGVSSVSGSSGLTGLKSYNNRGWLLTETSPSRGTITYTYNALGEVLTRKNAKQEIATFAYDSLGRVVSRSEPSMVASWTWDAAPHGVGKLASSSTNDGVI